MACSLASNPSNKGIEKVLVRSPFFHGFLFPPSPICRSTKNRSGIHVVVHHFLIQFSFSEGGISPTPSLTRTPINKRKREVDISGFEGTDIGRSRESPFRQLCLTSKTTSNTHGPGFCKLKQLKLTTQERVVTMKLRKNP
ncbi:uncharacterized protein LOC143851357 isoform X1 [Tasmannia lanceolata]|uniref:uncharacterized protein LOC143851357 isoform X1 n=1 Tax=Tasmannia lanceolata TaxID=3420 RepID=UPI004063F01D